MSQPVVDTLQLCDALRKTGMEREQAEGIARALGDELGAHVVAQGDLQTGFLEVRGEIQSVDRPGGPRADGTLDQKVDSVRTELGGRIDVLDGKVDSVRTELGGRIDALASGRQGRRRQDTAGRPDRRARIETDLHDRRRRSLRRRRDAGECAGLLPARGADRPGPGRRDAGAGGRPAGRDARPAAAPGRWVNPRRDATAASRRRR